MFIKTAAAPPNNIAGPTVAIGYAPPVEALDPAAGGPAVDATLAVGVATPLVNGISVPADADGNAGTPVVAPSEGSAEVLLGLSTLK